MQYELASQSEHFDEVFLEQDWQGKLASGIHFQSCQFNQCKMLGASFVGCRFIDCHFDGCDLSLVDFGNSKFQNVRFKDCKLVGINWTKADWSAALGGIPQFEQCMLDHSSFLGLDLAGVTLQDCVAKEVDFRGADLSGADLRETDFSGSLFQNTKLQKADFRRAQNYWISPLINEIKGAKFILPEALALLEALDIELLNEDTGKVE